MERALKFEVLSGGSVIIDYNKCKGCKTHACVRHCQSSALSSVLKIENDVPVLADTSKDTKQG